MKSGIEKIRLAEAELNRIIRGKPEVIHNLLIAFVSGGNILLDDVPGVGKTTLAKALARLVDAQFSRIQFTPDLLPADIIGTNIYNPREGSFQFRPGPVFTNILLADEINRASPRTQSALLECMCEHQVSSDGKSRLLPDPFMVIATQNPIEFQGTYPLPEAQLDRFSMRLSLGYPGEGAEKIMHLDRRYGDPLQGLSARIGCAEIIELREQIHSVGIEESVLDYLLMLVEATRREPRLSLGASPRAGLLLADAARASALLAGRDYVIPDEVRSLAMVMLPHRLVADAKARYSGITTDAIVKEIIKSVKLPR